MKLLLTHVPLARRTYYGARALARLQELVEVTLHEGDAPLDPRGVIAAAHDADLIIADRSTAVPGEIFASLPGLRVVMRSAVDIRNIDVARRRDHALGIERGVALVQCDLDQFLQAGECPRAVVLPPGQRHVSEK